MNNKSTNKINNQIHIVKLILCLIVSFTLTYAIIGSFGLEVSFFAIIGVALVGMLAFSILLYSRITINIMFLVITVSAAVMTFLISDTEGMNRFRERFYEFYGKFVVWFVSYYMSGMPRNHEYENYVFCTVCVCVTLLAYIFIVKKYMLSVLFIGGFSIFCIQWCFGFKINFIAFYIFIPTILFAYVFSIYCKSIENYDAVGVYPPLKFIILALPLCLLSLFLVNILPTPNSPLRWDWLYSKVNQATSYYRENFGYHTVDKYGLNTTGFSDGESFLSGPVHINDTPILTVKTGNPSIYLKGNGKNEYTGNSWKSTGAGADVDTDVDTDVDAGTGTDADMDASAGTGADTGTGTGVDTVTGVGMGVGTVTGAGTSATAGTDTGTGAGAGTGTGVGASSNATVGASVALIANSTAVSDSVTASNLATAPDSAPASGLTAAADLTTASDLTAATDTSTAPDKVTSSAKDAVTPAVASTGASTITSTVTSTDTTTATATATATAANANLLNSGVSEFLSDGSEIQHDSSELRSGILIYLFRLAAAGLYETRGQPLSRRTLEAYADNLLDESLDIVNISFNRFRSRSVFIPLKTKDFFSLSPSGGKMFEESGALIMENRVSEGFSYEVEYYIEENIPIADEIAKNSYRGIYDDMLAEYDTANIIVYSRNRGSFALFGGGATYLEMNDFIDRETLLTLKRVSEEIREKYLALPDALPDRVRELSNELTNNIPTDYAKIKELIAFLGARYTYNLNTTFLPPGEDFVDNFLFERKDGYCTHFASALAIMSRCIGIPSRYVEGYILPIKQIDVDTYQVTNAEAHAWVEIYLEGYGWKKFEPTGAFGYLDGEQEEQTTTEQPQINESDYSDIINQIIGAPDWENDVIDNLPDDEPPENNEPSPNSNKIGLLQKIISNSRLTALICIVLAIIFFALYGWIKKTLRRKSFKSEPREAVHYIFMHCVKVLSYMGVMKRNNETPSQYALRVEETYEFKEDAFLRATAIFAKACYSNHAINEEELNAVVSTYIELTTIFANNCNLFKLVLYNTFLGAI